MLGWASTTRAWRPADNSPENDDPGTGEDRLNPARTFVSVSGTLATKMDAVDVFKACFPAGTLTGAPKVKAMEIIERLEPTKRAIYGGAVGYMTFNGDMDVCIAIRTIFKKDGIAYLQAGAGIVADSIPEHEYLETMNKANGLLKAVEYAEGGLI